MFSEFFRVHNSQNDEPVSAIPASMKSGVVEGGIMSTRVTVSLSTFWEILRETELTRAELTLCMQQVSYINNWAISTEIVGHVSLRIPISFLSRESVGLIGTIVASRGIRPATGLLSRDSGQGSYEELR